MPLTVRMPCMARAFGPARHSAWAGPLLLSCLLACTPGLPGPSGVRPTAVRPDTLWVPPPPENPVPEGVGRQALPGDLAERAQRLTLADMVDVALRNNPATRLSWAQAREAAAQYGVSRSAWFPTIDVSGTFTRLKTVASQGRSAVKQNTYGPSVTASWLLLDVGGRSGQIDASAEALYAANWQHNATIQNVVIHVDSAYFGYVAQRALLEAQRASLAEADSNLAAAEERRRVGVATIADVLQARTAQAQARLAMQQTGGSLQVARGLLAQALGYSPTLPYEVDSTAGTGPTGAVVMDVDSLIVTAMASRPDLAAVRAQAREAEADIRVARAGRLPSLNLAATGGRTYTTTLPNGGNNYTLSLVLSLPVFSGFRAEYTEEAARFRADEAAATLDLARQAVALQVFQSYYTLQTAAQQVRTALDLAASASQSADVARGQYKAGVGSVLDLLTAQSALASARSGLVQARLAWYLALAQLSHDAGLLDVRGETGLQVIPDSTTVESH